MDQDSILFRSGDFVKARYPGYTDSNKETRLVINCYDPYCRVIIMDSTFAETGANHSYYIQIEPTKEDLINAKKAIDKWLGIGVDNLTYVEICARIKEYERKICFSTNS